MAWDERDYYREEPRTPGFMSRLGPQSVVTWLLVINVAIFLLDSILTGSARAGGASSLHWGEFNLHLATAELQLWRWVTYQFLHLDLLHLLFNMIGLFFFGPLMEQWWGSRRFLAFYLLCGVSGGILYAVLSAVPGLFPGGGQRNLVGASGAIFGILVACAVLFPRQRVMLIFPPIPMTMRTMALVFLGISVLSLLAGARNAGGEAAHLGGAALGFVLARFPSLLAWAGSSRLSLSTVRESIRRRRRQRDRETAAREEAEVDRILIKVREQGLHSLTRSEKRTLQRATNRQRKAG